MGVLRVDHSLLMLPANNCARQMLQVRSINGKIVNERTRERDDYLLLYAVFSRMNGSLVQGTKYPSK
jgi:hypothetical protein